MNRLRHRFTSKDAVTREGLACDWHGPLYPCHRAMEIETQFAIGSIYEGIDPERSTLVRGLIQERSLGSNSAKKSPLITYCPVAIYQKHGDFGGDWSKEYCEMINLMMKLVAKYYFTLAQDIESLAAYPA